MHRPSRPLVRLLTVASLFAATAAPAIVASQLPSGHALAAPNTDCANVTEPPTVNGIVQLTTPGQLKWLATNPVSLSATIEQQNDLDLTNCGSWPGIGGGSSNPFTGTYDGGGNTISNVSISASTDYWGLFRNTDGATLRDLTLDGVTISASGFDRVGGLVGRAVTTTINSVTVTHAQITGEISTGGLVGENDGGSITNSSSSGTVIGPWDYTGGLVGENYGPISDSHSTADVTGLDNVGGLVGYHENWYGSDHITSSYATGDVTGGRYVGGLVGYNETAAIDRSFATGDVVGTGSWSHGGLIGENYGPVSDSYATGAVNGADYVGGLAGYHEEYIGSDITHAYSTGSVAATGTPLGGLVGDNDGALITGSFWDRETSALSTSDGGTGLTTAQMKAFTTFDTAGWSITNGDADQTKVWGICDGLTYPFLMWQTQLPVGEPGRVVCPSGAGTTAAVVLPPAINELISQPVATSTTTTIAPSTTTTTVPVATTAPVDTTPPPVLIDGALPELAAGDVTILEDGQLVTVETSADGNSLVLQATTFELRVEGDCSTGHCSIDTTPEGRAVLTLEQDGSVTTTGIGFEPGSTVHVWLFSEPRYLGALTVLADGTFQGTVALGDLDVGEHTLQVNGLSQTGAGRSASLGVIVEPAQTPTPAPGVLPATGSSATTLWLIALTLIGLGLVSASRRQRNA